MNPPPTTLTNHNPPATIGCGLNPNPIRREESDTPHSALRHPEPHLEPLNRDPAAVRGHHFPSASSLSIALSSSASANSFFNRAFSASSSLSRLASAALMPA